MCRCAGEVTSGEITLPVYNNNQPYTNGFNLVGNPYPSPVDWNLIDKLCRLRGDAGLPAIDSCRVSILDEVLSAYANASDQCPMAIRVWLDCTESRGRLADNCGRRLALFVQQAVQIDDEQVGVELERRVGQADEKGSI